MFDRTIQLLESSKPVFGEFNLSTLPEQESVKGVLSWGVEDGAKLILLEPGEAWQAHELGGQHRVFGLLSDNTLITLPEARVSGYHHSAMFEATFRSSSLLLGANVEEDEDVWSEMSFGLAHLHGWLPRTGISGPEYEWDEKGRLQRVHIDWSPAEPVEVTLEDGVKIKLGFGMQAPMTVSPRRTIETNLMIQVSDGRAASIDEFERRHLRPWLVFSTVVADCWDSPTFHQVSGAEFELPVRVLHEGRTAVARDWQPGRNLYLFSAEDCEDIVAVMTRWLELYERAGLPIAVYAETLRDGNSYSPGRLIQLVTALEGYCDAIGLRGRTLLDKFKALRDKSDVDPEATSVVVGAAGCGSTLESHDRPSIGEPKATDNRDRELDARRVTSADRLGDADAPAARVRRGRRGRLALRRSRSAVRGGAGALQCGARRRLRRSQGRRQRSRPLASRRQGCLLRFGDRRLGAAGGAGVDARRSQADPLDAGRFRLDRLAAPESPLRPELCKQAQGRGRPAPAPDRRAAFGHGAWPEGEGRAGGVEDGCLRGLHGEADRCRRPAGLRVLPRRLRDASAKSTCQPVPSLPALTAEIQALSGGRRRLAPVGSTRAAVAPLRGRRARPAARRGLRRPLYRLRRRVHGDFGDPAPLPELRRAFGAGASCARRQPLGPAALPFRRSQRPVELGQRPLSNGEQGALTAKDGVVEVSDAEVALQLRQNQSLLELTSTTAAERLRVDE